MIDLLIDEVRRRAGDLCAISQNRFMHMMAVHARPAERRNQRRMDVDDPMLIRPNDLAAQNRQITRQHDQIRVRRFQLLENDVVESLVAPRLLFADKFRRNAVLFRPLKGKRFRCVGKHQNDLPVDGSGFHRVDERLQIRAAAGAEHRNPLAHSRTSLSPSAAVLATRPMRYAFSPCSSSVATSLSASSSFTANTMPMPMLKVL